MSDHDSVKPHEERLEHAHPLEATASAQDAEIEPELHWRTWVVVGSAVMSYLAGVIFLSSCGFWASVITADVGGADVSIWIAQAWNPPVAVLAPPISRIGDKCGRRHLWMIATLLGIVGAIVVASAHNVGAAIAGVAIYALGFANSGNVFAVPAEVLPRRHRGTAAMAVSIGGYFGAFVGVLGGAAFITNNPGGYAGWRSLFWLIAGVHALSLGMIATCYHPPPPPNPGGYSLRDRLLDFDMIGTILLTIALVPLLVGLFAGGVTSPWSDAKVVGPLVIGAVFCLVFAAHQYFIKKDGLLDHGMFPNRNGGLCLFAIAVEGFVYNAFTNFYGQESGALFDARPVYLGLRFSVFGLCAVIATPAYMYASYRYRLLNAQLSFGFILFLIGVIGLATVQPGSGKAIIGYCAICGVGFASPISCLLSVAQLSMPPKYAGQISGLMISFRSVGGSIGPAIVSAVVTPKLTSGLPKQVAEAAIMHGLPTTSLTAFVTAIATGAAESAAAIVGVTPAILTAAEAAVKQAYADAYRFVWIVLAPFILVSLACCLLMKNVREEMTYIVDRPVEEIHHKHRSEKAHA